ncbi:MAG: DUF1127 domain-containing protein [Pseudomonadota bacterium]|nr:DUF1127 domain-containing protein [Pseudomonadota bacterium]
MTAIQASGARLHRDREAGRGLGSWFSALFRQIGRFSELYMSKRSLLLLSRADDRMLKDIGVTRGDIDWALSQPWHVDGTVALAARIERRRSARRTARRIAGR